MEKFIKELCNHVFYTIISLLILKLSRWIISGMTSRLFRFHGLHKILGIDKNGKRTSDSPYFKNICIDNGHNSYEIYGMEHNDIKFVSVNKWNNIETNEYFSITFKEYPIAWMSIIFKLSILHLCFSLWKYNQRLGFIISDHTNEKIDVKIIKLNKYEKLQ